VRGDGYLERVGHRLRRWADDGEHRRPDSADGREEARTIKGQMPRSPVARGSGAS
jgi:hypothetical protein